MFFYDPTKGQILEVEIIETYSISDFERLLLFIDALAADSNFKVTFKIHPSVKKEFLTYLDSSTANPSYRFSIN